MNKIYYRGNAYDFKQTELRGERVFALLHEGDTVQYVKEEELDIRSRVSLILDAHYRTVRPATPSTVLG